MTDTPFAGSTAIVTGAARGQGRAMALALAGAGADVAICDVGQPALATVDYALATTADLDRVAEEIRALHPGFTSSGWLATSPMTDAAQRASLANALSALGL